MEQNPFVAHRRCQSRHRSSISRFRPDASPAVLLSLPTAAKFFCVSGIYGDQCGRMSTKLSSCLPDFPLGSALTDSLTKQMASPHPNFPLSVLDFNRRRAPGEAGARSCTPANTRFQRDASESTLMPIGRCYSISAALRRALLTSFSLMG